MGDANPKDVRMCSLATCADAVNTACANHTAGCQAFLPVTDATGMQAPIRVQKVHITVCRSAVMM